MSGTPLANGSARRSAPSPSTGSATPSSGSLEAGTTPLPKKLIVACDGTWQKSDGKTQNPTNVTRLARGVSNYDTAGHQQIVYYQAGVGTGLGFLNHIWGGATGAGLGQHIQEAYAFLTLNYTEHEIGSKQLRDSIFLIGFSRGAYTARSIGGLLAAVGLVKKPALPYLYLILQDWEHAGKKDYQPQFWDAWNEDHNADDHLVGPRPSFAGRKPVLHDIDEYMEAYKNVLMKRGLTQEVEVKAIGVFDTVGSLGIPINPKLQRVLRFLPNYIMEYAFFDTRIGKNVRAAFQALALDERRHPYQPAIWEDKYAEKTGTPIRVKQTWFPGAHSNVGGGYSQTGISDLSLAWMMDHLSNNQFKDPKLECESCTGSERSTDEASEVAPEKVHDSLNNEALNWIKFDDDVTRRLFEARKTRDKKEYELDGTGPSFRKWGMGFIYDSYNFPQSFLGSTVRTPGCHYAVDFTNGRNKDELLKATNEYIHRSVRVRLECEGRAPEPNWSQACPHGLNIYPWIKQAWYGAIGRLRGKGNEKRFWPMYNPLGKKQALSGWDYDNRPAVESVPGTFDPARTNVKWHYGGQQQMAHRTLPEDQLGKYEATLWALEHERGEPIRPATMPNLLTMIWKQFTKNLRRGRAM